MREVNLRAELLILRECLEFRTVIRRHGFEYLAESLLAIQFNQLFHGRFYASTIPSRDTDCNIVVRHLFDSSERDGFTTFTLANDGIHLPMADFCSFADNGGAFLNTAPFDAPVFPYPLPVAYTPEYMRHVK